MPVTAMPPIAVWLCALAARSLNAPSMRAFHTSATSRSRTTRSSLHMATRLTTLAVLTMRWSVFLTM